MREIKFRGKRVDNGEWAQGCYIKVTPYKDNDGHRICTQDTWDMISVDPSTIGQFTGLRDKNGMEIYEGDVLHKRSYWDIQVEFDRGSFRGRDTNNIRRSSLCTDVNLEKILDFEVIGNIHDNPELIREDREHG